MKLLACGPRYDSDTPEILAAALGTERFTLRFETHPNGNGWIFRDPTGKWGICGVFIERSTCVMRAQRRGARVYAFETETERAEWLAEIITINKMTV